MNTDICALCNAGAHLRIKSLPQNATAGPYLRIGEHAETDEVGRSFLAEETSTNGAVANRQWDTGGMVPNRRKSHPWASVHTPCSSFFQKFPRRGDVILDTCCPRKDCVKGDPVAAFWPCRCVILYLEAKPKVRAQREVLDRQSSRKCEN